MTVITVITVLVLVLGGAPLSLGWQRSASPAAPGLCFMKREVRGRLCGHHISPAIKTLLLPAAITAAPQVSGVRGTMRLTPREARRAPPTWILVATRINKRQEARPGDRRSVDAEGFYFDTTLTKLIVKGETSARTCAQLNLSPLDSKFSNAQSQAFMRVRLVRPVRQTITRIKTKLLSHHDPGLGVHVLMHQSQAKEVELNIVRRIGRQGTQQSQAAFTLPRHVIQDAVHGRQIQCPA